MSGRCYRQRSSRACEFPFALDEGGHSKGSAKMVMLRGRTDALRWRLNRTKHESFAVRICRDPLGQLSPISTGSNAMELRSFHSPCWWMGLTFGRAAPWRRSEEVPPEVRVAHQAKWTAMAAAAVAALLQGIQISLPLSALSPLTSRNLERSSRCASACTVVSNLVTHTARALTKPTVSTRRVFLSSLPRAAVR